MVSSLPLDLAVSHWQPDQEFLSEARRGQDGVLMGWTVKRTKEQRELYPALLRRWVGERMRPVWEMF